MTDGVRGAGAPASGTIGRDLLANLVSRTYVGILNVIVVPVYVRHLGIDSWGIVGTFLALQSVLFVLDFGISPLVARELALTRASNTTDPPSRISLVHTAERIYWLLGLAGTVVFVVFASTLLGTEVKGGQLSKAQFYWAVGLTALSVGLQWPVYLYGSALLGLGRQLEASILNATVWTLRTVGSVVALVQFDGSLVTFCTVQCVVSLLGGVCYRHRVARALRQPGARPRFDVAMIRRYGGFALSMGLVSVLLTLLAHLDRLFLTAAVSLADLGHYALAWQLTGALYLVYQPAYSVYLPLLSGAVATRTADVVSTRYVEYTAVLTLLLVPASVTVAIFAEDVLFAWTGDMQLSVDTSRILKWLILGGAVNALYYAPYCLQQALGKTNIALTNALVIVGLTVFVMGPVAHAFGGLGAALTFATASTIHTVSLYRKTHVYFSINSACRRSVLQFFVIVLLVATMILLVFRYLRPPLEERMQAFGFVSLAYCMTMLVIFLSFPAARTTLLSLFSVWQKSARAV
jgi:O-antigen/teichoic acid export membrane protein